MPSSPPASRRAPCRKVPAASWVSAPSPSPSVRRARARPMRGCASSSGSATGRCCTWRSRTGHRASRRMRAAAASRWATSWACASRLPPCTCSLPGGPGTRRRTDVAVVARDVPLAPRTAVRSGRWANALWVAPYFALYLALIAWPLVAGIWLSLHKADFFGEKRFVGLENFVRLLNDEIFLGTVWNTFYFIFLTVPALAVIGLALALALNRETRTAAVLRAVFFSSSVLSVTIVTLLWRVVFIPDGGFLATVLGFFDRPPVAWLNDEDLALPAIAITTI